MPGQGVCFQCYGFFPGKAEGNSPAPRNPSLMMMRGKNATSARGASKHNAPGPQFFVAPTFTVGICAVASAHHKGGRYTI